MLYPTLHAHHLLQHIFPHTPSSWDSYLCACKTTPSTFPWLAIYSFLLFFFWILVTGFHATVGCGYLNFHTYIYTQKNTANTILQPLRYPLHYFCYASPALGMLFLPVYQWAGACNLLGSATYSWASPPSGQTGGFGRALVGLWLG